MSDGYGAVQDRQPLHAKYGAQKEWLPLCESPELLHVELLPGAGCLVCFQAWKLLGKPGTGCQSPLRQRVAVGALQAATAYSALLRSSAFAASATSAVSLVADPGEAGNHMSRAAVTRSSQTTQAAHRE